MMKQACPVPYMLTKTQAKALKRAYQRGEPYYVCPTPGLWAASQTSVINALRRDGYITEDGSPTLTEKGKMVAADLVGKE